jgi:hypothetical protein
MRLVFLALLLANLALFAYARYGAEQATAAARLPLLQISPEKIRPLKADGAPRAAAPAPAAAAPSAVCLEWGLFAGPDAARADAEIAALGLPPAQLQRVVIDAGGHWVYMPPLKTRAEVDRKIGELKALGVVDFFVVQEPAQWRNAISLGIFRSEEAASAFLAALRDKGVRSAVSARRENFLKQIAWYVREPAEATVSRLTELQRAFPGSELKAAPCPAAAAAEAAKG